MQAEGICPDCNEITYYNSYFSKMTCPYCGYMGERIDKFKGNEELLDEFIDELIKCIKVDELFFKKQELKQSLIKLLNSL